jgi:sugar phosphate isomerase/epimerase
MFEKQLSISTWSLHHCLGPLRWTKWDESSKKQVVDVQEQPQERALTELPALAALHGLSYLEVCHFHFPSVEKSYLEQLKAAFDQAGVSFHTLLVDYGDISSPDEVRRQSDIRYLQGWIDVASLAGAKAIRIVAGEQPASDAAAIHRSHTALRQLQEYAVQAGVEVVTENFRELTSTVASWSQVLEGTSGARNTDDADALRTIVDFGNLAADEKLQGIAYGARVAHSFHVKPVYLADSVIDKVEFHKSLSILREQACKAPISIIYDREGDMWEGIERIKRELLT